MTSTPPDNQHLRKVKFRAWDNEHGTGMFYPLEWFFGNVVKAKHPAGKTINVIPMEDTGYLDKYDKTIYEGDIVITEDQKHSNPARVKSAVEYREGGFYVEVDGHDYSYLTVGLIESEDYEIEVVGNIYENPEMRSHEALPSNNGIGGDK